MNQKDTHGRAERWLVLLDFRVARLKFCRHRGESRPRGPTAAAGHDGPPRQRASRCERTLSEPSSATSGPKKVHVFQNAAKEFRNLRLTTRRI